MIEHVDIAQGLSDREPWLTCYSSHVLRLSCMPKQQVTEVKACRRTSVVMLVTATATAAAAPTVPPPADDDADAAEAPVLMPTTPGHDFIFREYTSIYRRACS